MAIVTTMRADFVAACLDYGKLVQPIQDQAVWLGPLQGEDLIQAIGQPARDQGYTLGSGLLEFILDDVKAEKNCLPLLEFALTELWEQRDSQKRELPLQAYIDMQRLTGALNKRAEDVYNNELNTKEERNWARRICLELVRIGPDVQDLRQRQPRKALLAMGETQADQDTIDEVIEILVQGRLLVATTAGEVDLGHEALMIGWKRFGHWQQEDRDRRRLIQRVRDTEREWNGKGRDDNYLLQGGLLAEVREQWQTLEAEFISSTRKFYYHSKEKRKQAESALEEAKEKRKPPTWPRAHS